MNATSDPRDKLRAVVGFFVQALTGPLASSWELRILAREVITPASPLLLEREIADRMRIIKSVVSAVMGLPASHPAVALGYISVMAPSLMLLIGDRDRFRRVFPALKFEPAMRETITERLGIHFGNIWFRIDRRGAGRQLQDLGVVEAALSRRGLHR